MKHRVPPIGCRGLGDGDAQELIEVVPRSHLERDPRDETLAFERVRERDRRRRPRESEARLRRERLHDCELVGLEDARRTRPEHQDADRAGCREDRHERGALDADALELLGDDAGRGRVDHRERRLVAERSGDAARLLLEIECQALQPGHVLIPLARGDDARGPAVRIDQRERGDVDREEAKRLVRDEAPDRLGVTCPREILREPVSGVGVESGEVVERHPRPREQQPAVGPAAEEDDGGDHGDDDHGE